MEADLQCPYCNTGIDPSEFIEGVCCCGFCGQEFSIDEVSREYREVHVSESL